MAYDFLVLRSQSINPELKSVADFWTKAQVGYKPLDTQSEYRKKPTK